VAVDSIFESNKAVEESIASPSRNRSETPKQIGARAPSRTASFRTPPLERPSQEQVREFQQKMESRREFVDKTSVVTEGMGKRRSPYVEESVFRVTKTPASAEKSEEFRIKFDQSGLIVPPNTDEIVLPNEVQQAPSEPVTPLEDNALVSELHNAEDEVSNQPPSSEKIDEKALAAQLRDILKATRAEYVRGVDVVKVNTQGDTCFRRIILRNSFLCSEAKGFIANVKGWHCWHILQIEGIDLGFKSDNFVALQKKRSDVSASSCTVIRFSSAKPLSLMFPNEESRNSFALLFRVLRRELEKSAKAKADTQTNKSPVGATTAKQAS